LARAFEDGLTAPLPSLPLADLESEAWNVGAVSLLLVRDAFAVLSICEFDVPSVALSGRRKLPRLAAAEAATFWLRVFTEF
jgi:hypothetical protein